MEKKFISCDMLSYRVWNELVPLLGKKGIIIYKMEGGSKYIYVEYLVNSEEYELVNKLTRKVQNMLDIWAYKSTISIVKGKRDTRKWGLSIKKEWKECQKNIRHAEKWQKKNVTSLKIAVHACIVHIHKIATWTRYVHVSKSEAITL